MGWAGIVVVPIACWTVRGHAPPDAPDAPADGCASVAVSPPPPHAAKPKESTAPATPTARALNALIACPSVKYRFRPVRLASVSLANPKLG
ncbi:hypothetical protein GCM10023259_011690 [Thermocatellispora tengchongensis]